MISVISTGFAHATKDKCLASVRAQRGVAFEHIYVEASEQTKPKGPLENFYDVAMRLPKDRIIACLDGDDWLSHDRSLATVASIYDRAPHTLVTYGQYRLVDWPYGQSAGCSEYPRDEYRRDVWRASHLKTFRAGAFQRIKKEDLMYQGRFAEFTCDLVVMFPILEMAGPERTVFNREVIYDYSLTHAIAMSKRSDEMARAHEIERHVRNALRYERIGDL